MSVSVSPRTLLHLPGSLLPLAPLPLHQTHEPKSLTKLNPTAIHSLPALAQCNSAQLWKVTSPITSALTYGVFNFSLCTTISHLLLCPQASYGPSSPEGLASDSLRKQQQSEDKVLTPPHPPLVPCTETYWLVPQGPPPFLLWIASLPLPRAVALALAPSPSSSLSSVPPWPPDHFQGPINILDCPLCLKNNNLNSKQSLDPSHLVAATPCLSCPSH